MFVANNAYQHLKGKKTSFKELLQYPILMLDRNSTTSEFLHNIFQQHQLDLVPEIELSSNDFLLDLAKIGLGIAFMPDYCIKDEEQDLFFVETEETLPGRELAIVYNNRIPISRVAQEFLNYF